MNEEMITVPTEFKTDEPQAELAVQEMIEVGVVPTEQLEAAAAPEATRRDLGRRVVVLKSGQFTGDPSRVFGHPAQQEKQAQSIAAMTGYYIPPPQQQ